MLLELCIVIQCDVIKQNEPKFRLHHIFIFFFWLYWPDKLQYFKTTKKISFHLAIMFQITILESSSSFLLDHSMYVPFATKYWLLWVIDIKLHENATDLQIYLSNRTVFLCNFTLHFKTWSHSTFNQTMLQFTLTHAPLLNSYMFYFREFWFFFNQYD